MIKKIRIIPSTLEKIVKSNISYYNQLPNVSYFGTAQIPELAAFLYNKGYRSLRSGGYYTVTENEIKDKLMSIRWRKFFGDYDTPQQALGYEMNYDEPTIQQIPVEKEEFNNGYKIIQDNGKYNLMSKSGNKTFGNPVDKIWFNEEENTFYFQNGRFTYKGMPGQWSKTEIAESISNVEIDEEVNEKRSNQDFSEDFVSITSDMNLGEISPLEF